MDSPADDAAQHLVPAVNDYPNGQARFHGQYLDGEMHGDWEFFRTDGTVMRSGTFDRGRQVGVWRTFARDGRLVSEKDFGAG